MSLFSIFSKKPSEPTSVAEALAGASEGPATKPKSRRGEKSQADSQNDQLIPEKKRARRRLIGAVAIVLAVVIGLPMVLDSEPKPLNKNIVIQIPSKESSTSSNEQKQEAVQDEVADQAQKPAPAVTKADPTPVTPTPTVATVQIPAGADSPIKPVAPVAKNDVKKSAEKAADKRVETGTEKGVDSGAKKESPTKTKADSKSSDTHTANSDEAARAMAILSGSDPAAKAPTRIVVQVGAFATQEKVNELQDKLNSAGIKSFTQKVATSSGDKIRVRIGPFSDKESADKVKHQLEKMGLNGSLISL